MSLSQVDKKEITLSLHNKIEEFLELFIIKDVKTLKNIQGEFSLLPNQDEFDLYGTIDAVYSFFIIDRLKKYTSINSRKVWATNILSCQDEQGWFTKRNLRGHSKEHATAYSIGALRLLEIENEESYVSKVKPLEGIREIFKTKKSFKKWIKRLGFKITLDDPVGHAGWHYIWRSSHLGGGIAAALGMTQELHKEWWPEVNTEERFIWYFDWLDKKVNKKTGYWQRAFWNWFVPGGTLLIWLVRYIFIGCMRNMVILCLIRKK